MARAAMTPSPDVVVIGAGAVGAACAHELASRGAVVDVLERGDGWATGCSAGNTGLIVPSHARPLANPAMLRTGAAGLVRGDARFGLEATWSMAPWAVRYAVASARNRSPVKADLLRGLATESLQRWVALAPAQLEQSGLLNVYSSEQGFAEAGPLAQAYQAAGARCEVLDAGAVRELEPSIHAHVAGGLHFPDEYHGDPVELVGAVGQAACRAGARLRPRTAVTRLHRDGRLETTEGDLHAGAVVVAAGAASGLLGVRLPLAAGRGSSVDVLDGIVHPRLPVVLEEAHVVASPFAGRTRLAGTFDICSAANEEPASARRSEAMLEGGRQLLTTTSAWSHAPVWTGSAPIATDGMPIIGPVPGAPQVVMATGHSMLGVTLAPVTGRLVADALDGGEVPRELSPLRFRRGRTRQPQPA